MWYRIELNKDGSVSSCEEASGSLANGKLVRYVEAATKEEALSKLARSWERRTVRESARKKQRREMLRANGLCVFCSAPAGGKTRCEECSKRESDRRAAVRSGAKVSQLRGPLSESEKAERQRLFHKKKNERSPPPGVYVAAKVAAFSECLRKFEELGSAFHDWLIARLETERQKAKRSSQERLARKKDRSAA